MPALPKTSCGATGNLGQFPLFRLDQKVLHNVGTYNRQLLSLQKPSAALPKTRGPGVVVPAFARTTEYPGVNP
jgi:hypothetical protein